MSYVASVLDKINPKFIHTTNIFIYHLLPFLYGLSLIFKLLELWGPCRKWPWFDNLLKNIRYGIYNTSKYICKPYPSLISTTPIIIIFCHYLVVVIYILPYTVYRIGLIAGARREFDCSNCNKQTQHNTLLAVVRHMSIPSISLMMKKRFS